MLRTISHLSRRLLTVCVIGGALAACGLPPQADTPDVEVDTDGDGVVDDDDVCADTASGAIVDAFGCDDVASAEGALVPEGAPETDLDGDGEVRPAERVLAAPPQTGDVINGFYPIVLDRAGQPHVLYANAAYVDDTGETVDVDGDVTLATPAGFVLLEDAQLSFDRDGDDIVGVTGSAVLPMPGVSLLAGVEPRLSARADVGYSPGSDLDVGMPLRAERSYLHFVLESQAVFSAGDLQIRTDGPGAVVALDPADPGLFLRGDLIGLRAIGPVEDVAIGLSFQGLIAFEPAVVPDPASGVELSSFDGNVFLSGEVPVPSLPLTLLGDTVIAVSSALADEDTHATIGANGAMDVVFKVLGFTVFESRLVDGSATINVDEDGAHAAWVGAPNDLVFSPALPLAGEATWMSGTARDDADPQVVADADLEIDGSWLTGQLLTPLPNIPLSMGDLIVDGEGLFFSAPLRAGLDIAGVKFGASAGCDVEFAHNAGDFSIVIEGYTDVLFRPPQPAKVTITPAGVVVE